MDSYDPWKQRDTNVEVRHAQSIRGARPVTERKESYKNESLSPTTERNPSQGKKQK